jgi:hypothetical protein
MIAFPVVLIVTPARAEVSLLLSVPFRHKVPALAGMTG